MASLKDKSNNELIIEIKQLELDHEALKVKMLKDYDKLMEIERQYAKCNLIINKRVKGEK
jgi:hypothetical protein